MLISFDWFLKILNKQFLLFTKVSELFNFSVEDLPVSSEHRQILSLAGRRIQDDVESSGYNWIRPSLWSSVFTSQVQPRAIKAT